jgi:hypothetical protein
VFRLRLLDEDGVDYGPLASSTPPWSLGDHIPIGGGVMLEVVRFVENPGSDGVSGYLIVKSI